MVGMGQSNHMVFAKVGTKEENLSPLTGFNINFMDHQALKLLEDSITDLQVIMPTLLSTVIRIREQCQMCCNMDCSNRQEKCDCDQQFDEYIKELGLYVIRADVLRDKAKCTVQLVSCEFQSGYDKYLEKVMVNMHIALGFTELPKRGSLERCRT
jgi:hypothetical protein